MNRTIRQVRRLEGEVTVPADKSIAHRAAIISAISDGPCRLVGYPKGADTLSTLSCLRQLGIEMAWVDDDLVIHGQGVGGLREPDGPLDCGNSGTTMRLLTGLLAGRGFDSALIGDASLQRRPMERVAAPLRAMGADIELTDGHAPIRIRGRAGLDPGDHELVIASAQVKTAIVLAAMTASGPSRIREPIASRDHTERMLGLNVELLTVGRLIHVDPLDRIAPMDLTIPGDFSSAAFFVAAATIIDGSEVIVRNVGVNPTRTGLLDVLAAAGAQLGVNRDPGAGERREPVSDLTIRSSDLRRLEIRPRKVPLLVDEVPVLAVVASRASGVSRFEGIGELRAKESDRIETTVAMLRLMGGRIEADDDSMTVTGPTHLTGAEVDSHGDHRIAMSAAVAGLTAAGQTIISRAEAASVSYPGFWNDLEAISRR